MRRYAVERRGRRRAGARRSPSVETTSTVTSSSFLIVKETRARSLRPSELGREEAARRTSFTGGGVRLRRWVTKNAPNVAHDERREREARQERHSRCTVPFSTTGIPGGAPASTRRASRMTPPWQTTSTGSCARRTISVEHLGDPVALLAQRLAAGEAERGRAVAPAANALRLVRLEVLA